MKKQDPDEILIRAKELVDRMLPPPDGDWKDRKFRVQISGRIPNEITVEAEDEDDAEQAAIEWLLGVLEFKATIVDEGNKVGENAQN